MPMHIRDGRNKGRWANKPSAATVHRTVAFKWVRVRFQQRIKATENVSFSMAFIGAGDRTHFIKVRLGQALGGNSPPDWHAICQV